MKRIYLDWGVGTYARGLDSIEWLSLMQHYGAQTRILDFIYLVYVALYCCPLKVVDVIKS